MKSHQLRRTLGALTGAVWFSLVCIASIAAAETASPAKVYALGSDSEHPIRVENIRLTEPTVRTDDYCRYKFRIAEQPSVRLRLLEPRPRLQIGVRFAADSPQTEERDTWGRKKGPGWIDGLVVKEPKESWCTNNIGPDAVNLPAGDYEIFIVTPEWRKGRFVVTITDPDRRASYGGVKPFQLPEKIEKPIILSGRMEKDLTERIRSLVRNGREDWCDDLVFARTPDFIIATTRPMSGLKAMLVPGTPGQRLRVIGPLGKARWNSEGRCSSGELEISEDIRYPTADGEYAIFVGGENATSKGSFRIVLSTPGTKVNPFDITVPIPDELPVAERVVKKFFPQVDRTTTFRALFLKVPRSLFVFPTLDLDNQIASGSGLFPKKDEPLLVMNVSPETVTTISARGHDFFIPVKYLSGSPRGIVRVPEFREGGFARTFWPLPPDVEAQIGRELMAARRRVDAAGDCYGNYFMKKTGLSASQASRIFVAHYKNNKFVRVENLGVRYEAVHRGAAKTCRVAEANAAHRQVYQRKDDAIDNVIRAYLAKLRARFASPPTQASRL